MLIYSALYKKVEGLQHLDSMCFILQCYRSPQSSLAQLHGFCPKGGLAVTQLLSLPTRQTSTHASVGSHDTRLKWNKAKSILEAEEEARLHKLKLQVLELRTLNIIEKVV